MQTVIIIAGGWSVNPLDVQDLRKRGYVIGVNDSAVLAQCHVGISMDRLWAEHRARQYFTTREGDLWVRYSAAKNLPYHPRLRKFECDHQSVEMSTEPTTLNGTNSGMVALNYAYKLRPERVFLFGFDMQRGPNGQPYWYPPYEWANQEGATKSGKYREWAAQFEMIKRQFDEIGCTVFNVNNRSLIEAFPQISYERFLEETA